MDNDLRFPLNEFPAMGHKEYPNKPNQAGQIWSMSMLGVNGDKTAVFLVDQPIIIQVSIEVREEFEELNISFMIHNGSTSDFISATHTGMDSQMPRSWPIGHHRVRMEFPAGILNVGRYYLRVGMGSVDGTIVDHHPKDGLTFDLIAASEVGPHDINSRGLLAVIPQFTIL